MTQPSAYARAYGATVFTDESTNTPTVPHTGVKMDGEFNNILTTLGQILVNLALIQRDDGQIHNASIGVDQLKSELQAGLNSPSAWVTATAYSLRDSVTQTNGFYKCLVAHTSGVFATDLAAGDWVLMFDFTAVGAAAVTAAVATITAAQATGVAAVQAQQATSVAAVAAQVPANGDFAIIAEFFG